MTDLIHKMIQAYYPGEDIRGLEWNEPDMREVFKVVLDDMRESLDPEGAYSKAILVWLDAYEKDLK